MKEQIHTIPVTDALKEPGACAFCVMKKKLEEDAVRFIMGPAYMEDDIRLETNRLGFCTAHLKAMYDAQNRLGLGLMLFTHIRELGKSASEIRKVKKQGRFFGKSSDSIAFRLAQFYSEVSGSCYVCDKVSSTFLRYIDTFIYIWEKDKEDAKLIKEQKGYCMPHFTELLSAAGKLGRSQGERFVEEIVTAQLFYMEELESDLDWFVQKFDFRNAGEPWKNSKDVLPRAIAFLGGEDE